MNDSTIANICETVSTWGGASASGLSASAAEIVGKIEVGLATQTAAINEYVGQIGAKFRELAIKAELNANQVSAVGERVSIGVLRNITARKRTSCWMSASTPVAA